MIWVGIIRWDIDDSNNFIGDSIIVLVDVAMTKEVVATANRNIS